MKLSRDVSRLRNASTLRARAFWRQKALGLRTMLRRRASLFADAKKVRGILFTFPDTLQVGPAAAFVHDDFWRQKTHGCVMRILSTGQ